MCDTSARYQPEPDGGGVGTAAAVIQPRNDRTADTRRRGTAPETAVPRPGSGPGDAYWFCTASRPARAMNETPKTRRIQATTTGREMMWLRTAAAHAP